MIVRRFTGALIRWLGSTRPRAGACEKRNAGCRDERDRFDTFTERARTVLALAQEEALRLSHRYMGTEHLLLGMLREGEGVLQSFGLSVPQVREKTLERLHEA